MKGCIDGGWFKDMSTLLKTESEGTNEIEKDRWYNLIPVGILVFGQHARFLLYRDGTGNPNHHNWHRAIFTPKYLKRLFKEVELINVKIMDRSEARGYDHGWINLGVKGQKPKGWKYEL